MTWHRKKNSDGAAAQDFLREAESWSEANPNNIKSIATLKKEVEDLYDKIQKIFKAARYLWTKSKLGQAQEILQPNIEIVRQLDKAARGACRIDDMYWDLTLPTKLTAALNKISDNGQKEPYKSMANDIAWSIDVECWSIPGDLQYVVDWAKSVSEDNPWDGIWSEETYEDVSSLFDSSRDED